MVEEGPYEILPYAEIDKLKKEIYDLKKKSASSDEVLDSINRLTKIIESMLHLFESAAAEMKREGEGSIGKKLDTIIEQHETIAESLLSIVDMIKEIQSKEQDVTDSREKRSSAAPQALPGIEPRPDFSMPPPTFEMQRMPPSPPMSAPPPSPQPPTPPPKEGPMPMPTGSFKDLKLPEMSRPQGVSGPAPKPNVFEKPKKGLFRR
jgi:hypothetical protein